MKPLHSLRSISLWAILFGLPLLSARAQNSATEGTDFYVTFTSNNNNTDNVCQVRYVVANTCYITAQYGDGTYLDNHVQYTPGVYTRDTDKSKTYSDNMSTGASNRMLHITSTQNIGVYALNMFVYTTDATAILPVTTWGTDYTLIGNSGDSYVTVIAPTAGTVFTIRNAAGTAVVSDRATNTASPVYHYVVSGDLTGYTVESNENVAVFSSCRCGSQVTTGACDHNYEQLYPTHTAGKNFFLWNLSPKYSTANTRDKVVLLALEDGTTVTKKVGATTTTIPLTRHQTNSFWLDTTVHVNNSSVPVALTSDKPIIVNHLLGYAPTIKWWSPVEQLVTQATLTPFIAAGSSVITLHQLDIMIRAGSQQNMIIRETRNGVVTTPGLTFYTNTSNSNYVIASRQYANTDDVMIELLNPSGFIAYMTGYGPAETYIYSAGSGAFNLQNYFTIATKTQPSSDTYYSATEASTHTFVPADVITVKRTLERSFTQIRWLIHNVPYTGVTENTNMNHTLSFPASLFHCGKDSLVMSVRYAGASVDSVYTGYVWMDNALEASVIGIDGSLSVCQGLTTNLTASSAALADPIFKWYASQTSTEALFTGATFATPALSSTTGYYVSISGQGVCETKAGKRKEVVVTVAAALTPGSIGSAQTICYHTTPAPLTQLTAPGGASGTYAYQWQQSADGVSWSDIPGALSGASYSPGALTADTYFRRGVTGDCGTTFSAPVLIRVIPTPTLNTPNNKEACVNTPVSSTVFTSSTPGLTFSWVNSNPSIGLAAGGSGNQPEFTALGAGQATITVTPYNNGCAGTSVSYTLTIHPCVIPVNPHLR
ncbi:MAG: hypothetical protein LBD89_08215 [Tannerellaceae bacterium]|jgi:hypothetical protein|nr:hypothetical protein [Tannerellaceae bacterium]